MRVIYKYLIPHLIDTIYVAPRNARVLQIDTQANDIMLWVLVDPKEELTTHRVGIFATGQAIPPDWQPQDYLGSFYSNGGLLVWHAFIPSHEQACRAAIPQPVHLSGRSPDVAKDGPLTTSASWTPINGEVSGDD